MQKFEKKKQPVKEPQKDNQRYQLHIEQIKLLKKIAGKAALFVKDDQNIIIKQIPFQTYDKQTVNILLNVDICCPKLCLVFCPNGHYYDQELGSIQVHKDHNICYIYADKYPYQRGCYVKYKLEQSKKRNHFDNNTVIFDQYLKNQSKNTNNRRHRDIINMSQQKKLMYEPKNKIVQLSEQQKDDSIQQLDYNESYDQNNKRIMKKVKQASQIVEKSLQKSEDEKKIFSKYLDQSTSFKLLGHLNTSKDKLPKLDISTIKQSNDSNELEMSTQQKWYKKRFNKINTKGKNKRAKIFKVIKTGKQTQSKVDLILSIQCSQNAKKKQIRDIIISSTQKPNEINLFVEDKANKKLKKLAKMVKQNGQPSSAWPVQLIINREQSPIHVSCIVCKQEYVGCIGQEEEKVGQCELFNKEGDPQGYIYFKCKQLCQSVAQTQDFIAPKEESELRSSQNSLKHIQQVVKNSGLKNQKVFTIPPKRSPNRTEQKAKQTEQQSEEILLISRSKTMPQIQENQVKKLQQQQNQEHEKKQNIFRKSIISQSHFIQIQSITARKRLNSMPDATKGDMVNFKILNINAKLIQPNFTGKFVKIQMSDQPPYFTQTSKQMFYLNWKGKGYIFFNCGQLSKFVLQIFEQNQETPFSIGNCQVNLSQLQPELKRINKYEDQIRNDKKECVGTIFIQYEFFQKNSNDLLSISPPMSRNKMEYHRSSPDSSRNANFKLKLTKQLSSRNNQVYSLKSSAISESNIKNFKKQRSEMNQSVNEKNSNSVEQHEKSPRSYSKNRGNKSSLKARKYNGGNIIIPRADRFESKVNYQVKIPGPGYYEYSSQFQRHGSPL